MSREACVVIVGAATARCRNMVNIPARTPLAPQPATKSSRRRWFIPCPCCRPHRRSVQTRTPHRQDSRHTSEQPRRSIAPTLRHAVPPFDRRLRYAGARHPNVWRRAEQCARKAQHRAHFGGHGFQGHGWMLASRAEAQQPWPTTSCTAVNCLPASAPTPLPTDTPRTHHSVEIGRAHV